MAIKRKLNKEEQIRFWTKVQKTNSCWLWTAAKTEKGYGVFGIKTKETDKAHRISYQLLVGKIPNKMFVCHSCDVPACVNPDHLFIGTNYDNVCDMISKKRNSPPPPMGGWNKIDLPIELINQLGKKSDAQLSREFGFNRCVINKTRKKLNISKFPRLKKGGLSCPLQLQKY